MLPLAWVAPRDGKLEESQQEVMMTADDTPRRVTGYDVHGITATSDDELEDLEVYEELVDLNRKRHEKEEEGSGGARPPMIGAQGQGSGVSGSAGTMPSCTTAPGVAAGAVQGPGGVGVGNGQAGFGAGAAQASGGFGGVTGREAVSRSSAGGGAMSAPPIGMTAAAGSSAGGSVAGYAPGAGSTGAAGGTQASGSSGHVAGYSAGTIAADGRIDGGRSDSDGSGGSSSRIIGGRGTNPGTGAPRAGSYALVDLKVPARGGAGGNGTAEFISGPGGTSRGAIGAGAGGAVAAGGTAAGGAAAAGSIGGWAGTVEASPDAIEARSAAWQEWAARMEDISKVLSSTTAERRDFGLVQTAEAGYHDSQSSSTKWSAQGSLEFKDFADAVSGTGQAYRTTENESTEAVKQRLTY